MSVVWAFLPIRNPLRLAPCASRRARLFDVVRPEVAIPLHLETGTEVPIRAQPTYASGVQQAPWRGAFVATIRDLDAENHRDRAITARSGVAMPALDSMSSRLEELVFDARSAARALARDRHGERCASIPLRRCGTTKEAGSRGVEFFYTPPEHADNARPKLDD